MQKIAMMVMVLSLFTACASPPAVLSTPIINQPNTSSAVLPANAPMYFQLNGKLGVQYAKQGFSANFAWQHTDSIEQIALFSPLGSQVAALRQTPDYAELVDDKQQVSRANTLVELTEARLGWSFPVGGLPYWVQGKVQPNSPMVSQQFYADGSLAELEQDDWHIFLEDYQSSVYGFFPHKLRLERAKPQALRLKILVQEWLPLTEIKLGEVANPQLLGRDHEQ